MKAINTTVLQAVNQFSELELLTTFVAGFNGEETADSELIIKTGQVIRVKKNSDEWPALITIRTDETPPQEVTFYDSECISIVYPDPDTAYFKNLATEQAEQILQLKSELEIACIMHVDNERYKWEKLGFGSVDELVEHYEKALKSLALFKGVVTHEVAYFIGEGIKAHYGTDSINDALAKFWVPVVGLLENLPAPRATKKYPAGNCKHGVILYGNECANCKREASQGLSATQPELSIVSVGKSGGEA